MVDPEDVDGDQGGHGGDVDGHADPHDDALPFLHFEVAQREDADEEAGQGAGKVRRVAHFGVDAGVSVVNGHSDVDADQEDDEEQPKDGQLHLLPILWKKRKKNNEPSTRFSSDLGDAAGRRLTRIMEAKWASKRA